MPNRKSIQISIPHPCAQSWDEMTPNLNGRYCDHCSKTVIDFTEWSDAALYTFFSKNTGNVCGRYLSTQLDRPIYIPYQPHSKLYRITVALGLTLLFTQTPHLLAQSRPPKIAQTDSIKQVSPNDNPTAEFHGRVLDDKKQELPSAVIQVYQNNILKGGAVTDYDGYFIIKSLEPGRYDILVLYAGFDSIKDSAILVCSDVITTRNYIMTRSQKGLQEIRIIAGYRKPLIDLDKPGTKTFTHEEIDHMPK